MNTKTFARVAMIAAVYTVVSLFLAPFSFSNIQVRIAEALTLLPLIYRPSIVGLTVGCFLTNLIGAMTGVNPTGMIDAVIGTAATLLAAICTYKLRDRKFKGIPVLAILMPVIFNFVFVGAELGYLFFPDNVIMGSLICGAEVAVGELISVFVGWFLIQALSKTTIFEE
ncbi:MAG: QueT transporter family protein [Erysipelotrichaceae bacterium]|nr:QueT transporter family protein [Erysipelotrichaceae bacterium]